MIFISAALVHKTLTHVTNLKHLGQNRYSTEVNIIELWFLQHRQYIIHCMHWHSKMCRIGTSILFIVNWCVCGEIYLPSTMEKEENSSSLWYLRKLQISIQQTVGMSLWCCRWALFHSFWWVCASLLKDKIIFRIFPSPFDSHFSQKLLGASKGQSRAWVPPLA